VVRLPGLVGSQDFVAAVGACRNKQSARRGSALNPSQFRSASALRAAAPNQAEASGRMVAPAATFPRVNVARIGVCETSRRGFPQNLPRDVRD
jgi:hypothetical protein